MTGPDPQPGPDPGGQSAPDDLSLPDDTVSWRQLRAEAARRLREAGDPLDPADADRDAGRIVEQASGLEGVEALLGLDDPATQRGVHAFDVMVARRLRGEPLQYVLGHWGFRTLDLLVDRRVLIPRPETEAVVDHALGELDRLAPRLRDRDEQRPPCVVDLGTGSGAMGFSIAVERPGVEVWATDASSDALAVARANLAGLGRAATRVRLAQGSWFEALPAELQGCVDLVVSNPPYVATDDDLPPVVRDWEPPSALFAGADGLDDLRHLVVESTRWLAPDGVLVVELAPHQADLVADLARSAGFAEAVVGADLAGRPRCVIARRS